MRRGKISAFRPRDGLIEHHTIEASIGITHTHTHTHAHTQTVFPSGRLQAEHCLLIELSHGYKLDKMKTNGWNHMSGLWFYFGLLLEYVSKHISFLILSRPAALYSPIQLKQILFLATCLLKPPPRIPSLLWLVSQHTPEPAQLSMSTFDSVAFGQAEWPTFLAL